MSWWGEGSSNSTGIQVKTRVARGDHLAEPGPFVECVLPRAPQQVVQVVLGDGKALELLVDRVEAGDDGVAPVMGAGTA